MRRTVHLAPDLLSPFSFFSLDLRTSMNYQRAIAKRLVKSDKPKKESHKYRANEGREKRKSERSDAIKGYV